MDVQTVKNLLLYRKWSLQSRIIDRAWTLMAKVTGMIPVKANTIKRRSSRKAHDDDDDDAEIPFLEKFEVVYNMVNLSILHTFFKDTRAL